MKITPCKKAKKPSLPPAKPALTEREMQQHLGGECHPIVNDDFKSLPSHSAPAAER